MSNSDYILDLKEKTEALIKQLYEQELIHSKTIKDFAKTYDLDYEKLKACWKSGVFLEDYDAHNRQLKFGKIKVDMQKKLAEIGRFNFRKPPWAGTGVPDKTLYDKRPDTHKLFKAHLQEVLTKETYYATSEDLSLLIEAEPPKNIDTDFASLSLDGTGQEVQPGENLQVFMESRFNSANISPDVKIGLRMVRLIFDEFDSRMTAPMRLGCHKDDKLSTEKVKIELGGNKWKPIWRFSVETGYLTSLVTGEKPLLELSSASEGNSLTVRLQTDLWDTVIDHRTQGGDIEENPLRQRLIKILENKGAGLKPDEGGWVTLGEQKLRIVAKKTEEK